MLEDQYLGKRQFPCTGGFNRRHSASGDFIREEATFRFPLEIESSTKKLVI
jgi:hypothetical protein